MGRPRKPKPVSLAAVQALRTVPTTTLHGENVPTPERLMKAGATVAMQLGSRSVQIIGPAADRVESGGGVMRLSEAPLDRLHSRNRLDEIDPARNEQLYDAGDKLRRHHYLAGLNGMPSNSNNFGSTPGGTHPSTRLTITETMESNRRALRRARDAMHPGVWAVVHDVVCADLTLMDVGVKIGFAYKNAASAVALDRLRMGLGILAEMWGFSPPNRPPLTVPPAANDAKVQRAA